ncbi:MAG: MXAN_6640 family putative metalloprotease [bacterium]
MNSAFKKLCILLSWMLFSIASVYSQIDRRTALEIIHQESKSSVRGEDEGIEKPKCGTSIFAYAHTHSSELTPSARLAYLALLERPGRQKERLSPANRFRIHYDTTGIHTPALISNTLPAAQIPKSFEQYVDSVAMLFDKSWDMIVQTMGFTSPPEDGNIGGGPEYDIYISELGTSNFGQTLWNTSEKIPGCKNEKFPTYIEIDNDFLGFRTSGMNGLKVTAAHELFHAVQVGSYGVWPNVPNSDFYFYELSSVWMEETAFDEINDYYYDVKSFFKTFRNIQSRTYSFVRYESPFFGYERSLWAFFLERRFGRNIIRSIWESMREASFLPSMGSVLKERGTSFEAEFTLFGYWNYFTADRADTTKFYREGNHYPRFVPNVQTNFNGSATLSTAAFPLSTQMFEFNLGKDTITAIVTNTDIATAGTSSFSQALIEFRLSNGDLPPPFQKLSHGILAGYTVEKPDDWRMMYIESAKLNNAMTASDPAPNPLKLNSAQALILPISAVAKSGTVTFYSASLENVFSAEYPVVESFGKRYIQVPVGNLMGKLSSGIYFIHAKCFDTDYRWKLAVIR